MCFLKGKFKNSYINQYFFINNEKNYIKRIKYGIKNKKKLNIVYKDRFGNYTIRLIHPYRIYRYRLFGNIYLDSYCELRHDCRVFKLLRIRELRVYDNIFIPLNEIKKSKKFLHQKDWKEKYLDNSFKTN
jgi:predicted DNA-binding transcriptional regulator YafY